ncbi:hypothetical protein BH23BAC1_BH23BAC1_18820 [soil metagenome]
MENSLIFFKSKFSVESNELILIFGLIIFSFQSYAQEEAPIEEITEEVVISFEATRCYGTCPVFSYNIYENGTARYIGKEYVENEGIYETEVSSDDMEELVEIFERYNFFDFKDRYTEHVSDLPTVYVYLSHDGKRKKVTDYYGAPESLKEMEKEILKKLRSLNWKKVHTNLEENTH